MKINPDNNNFEKENSFNLYLLKNYHMKTSKNLLDINEDSFDISNSPFFTYNKKKKSSIIANKKGKSISNIILNNEINESIRENNTTFTNQSLHQPKSLFSKKMSKDTENIKAFQNTKPKKRVKFNDNFATIIEIQSYKKYNLNNYLNFNKDNNNCSLKCSCKIF